ESELAVVALFQGIVEVGGGVDLAVVFDLLVALGIDDLAVLQREAVRGVLEVLLGYQYALEGFRIGAEGGAPLEALVVGIKVDALEILVVVVGRYVDGLGDGAVDPLLRRSLDIHVCLGLDAG